MKFPDTMRRLFFAFPPPFLPLLGSQRRGNKSWKLGWSISNIYIYPIITDRRDKNGGIMNNERERGLTHIQKGDVTIHARDKYRERSVIWQRSWLVARKPFTSREPGNTLRRDICGRPPLRFRSRIHESFLQFFLYWIFCRKSVKISYENIFENIPYFIYRLIFILNFKKKEKRKYLKYINFGRCFFCEGFGENFY